MSKRIIAIILAVFVVFSAGCSNENKQNKITKNNTNLSAESKQKRKIIIDTDTAGDDAVAMIIAAKTKNVDILGVTVSAGNVKLEQAVKNALMTLEIAGLSKLISPTESLWRARCGTVICWIQKPVTPRL